MNNETLLAPGTQVVSNHKHIRKNRGKLGVIVREYTNPNPNPNPNEQPHGFFSTPDSRTYVVFWQGGQTQAVLGRDIRVGH